METQNGNLHIFISFFDSLKNAELAARAADLLLKAHFHYFYFNRAIVDKINNFLFLRSALKIK
jgi:hypothetical protein